MTDLANAKKRCTGAASWLTRATTKCGELCEVNLQTYDKIEYENTLSNFDKRLEAWDKAELELEEQLEEGDLETEINKAAEYRGKCEKTKVKMMSLWNIAHPNVQISDDLNSSASSSSNTTRTDSKCKVKLPVLDIPKFTGDVQKFMPFWQQFEDCIDKQEEFGQIVKFNYLISLLKGDARNVLEGLPVTSENYEEAKKIIKSRYGRKELIIFKHVQSLINIHVPDTANISALVQFRDQLVAHVRSLAALEVDSKNFGMILAPIIVSRLPEEVRFSWAKQSGGKEADLDFLMQFLDADIQGRERCQSYGSLTEKPKVSTVERHDKRKVGSAVALQTFVKKTVYIVIESM